mmetsp:Transcript_51302/g.100751  ORF Transcript_51302/g.100751 Transcript_51302/m.100751 type:complete len:107 (-) Transcript_51302:57-377(-)
MCLKGEVTKKEVCVLFAGTFATRRAGRRASLARREERPGAKAVGPEVLSRSVLFLHHANVSLSLLRTPLPEFRPDWVRSDSMRQVRGPLRWDTGGPRRRSLDEVSE